MALAVECYEGDHLWRGSSVCALCGDRLRCINCGCFVREDGLGSHVTGSAPRCRWLRGLLSRWDERGPCNGPRDWMAAETWRGDEPAWKFANHIIYLAEQGMGGDRKRAQAIAEPF